jgi:hypothetical protein
VLADRGRADAELPGQLGSGRRQVEGGRVELGAAKSSEYGVLGARAVSRSTRSPPRRPRTVDSQAPYIWWRLRSCRTRMLATSSRTGEWAKRSWARSVCAMSISITSPTSSSKPVTLTLPRRRLCRRPVTAGND